MKGRLSFTVGMQRSGKSTYAESWVRYFDPAYPRVVVCGDHIRLATHGERYNKLGEDSVFSTLHIMIRTLLIGGYDVLVDETNTSKISIQRLLEIDPLAKAIQIDATLDDCIRRAAKTGQQDLIPAIKRTYRNLQSIERSGGLQVFMNTILDEIKERNNEYNTTIG